MPEQVKIIQCRLLGINQQDSEGFIRKCWPWIPRVPVIVDRICWIQWTICIGIGGRFAPESVDGIRRNRWTEWSRIRTSPVGLTFQSILNYHNSGDSLSRDVQLNRLGLLAKNLREINSFNPRLLSNYRKTIRRSGDINSFFGTRFEINITATLIRCQIEFEKSESPDFTIHLEEGNAAIECTSARIRKNQDNSDLMYKIKSRVHTKSKHSYANYQTALFIDITNLVFVTFSRSGSLDNLLDRKKLLNVVLECPFGNVTLFTYLTQVCRGGIESLYARVDHSRISQGLASILDKGFPYGHYPLNKFAVPEEG